MARLSKVQRSNRAHKRLRDRFPSLHRNHQYHQSCISKQNIEKRVLSKAERRKIWKSLSVAPW